MSINRKGSRKITVNSEIYLWRVRDNKDHITIVIQHQDENHQFIISSTESGVMLYGKNPPITPSIIEDMIKRALEKGWDPFRKTGDPIYIELRLPENGHLMVFGKFSQIKCLSKKQSID